MVFEFGIEVHRHAQDKRHPFLRDPWILPPVADTRVSLQKRYSG
jgi:hypothetical protein